MANLALPKDPALLSNLQEPCCDGLGHAGRIAFSHPSSLLPS